MPKPSRCGAGITRPNLIKVNGWGKNPFQNQVGYLWGKMPGHEARCGEVLDYPPCGHP